MFEKLPTSPTELKNSVLSEAIVGLKLNTFKDNFDRERFNFDGKDRSDIFNVGDRIFWFSWFFENYNEIFSVMNSLVSERSKRLLLNIIAFRLAGHHSIKIATGFSEDTTEFLEFTKSQGGEPSKLGATGMFGGLVHYDFIFENKHYVADCLGFKYVLHRKQYFFSEGTMTVEPVNGDVVIDAGACLGDTSVAFAKAVGPSGKVFAFEPVADNLIVLEHNAKLTDEKNIVAIPFGLSDQDVFCSPVKVGAYAPGFRSTNKEVPLRTLDCMVIEGLVPRVDFIKMDIEGSELSALRGASGSIRKFHPKLAISLYHKPNDIFEIPLYIQREFPFYTMYIGHYTIHNEETVLYCVSAV
jgi:FkbM family methyltransferase